MNSVIEAERPMVLPIFRGAYQAGLKSQPDSSLYPGELPEEMTNIMQLSNHLLDQAEVADYKVVEDAVTDSIVDKMIEITDEKNLSVSDQDILMNGVIKALDEQREKLSISVQTVSQPETSLPIEDVVSQVKQEVPIETQATPPAIVTSTEVELRRKAQETVVVAPNNAVVLVRPEKRMLGLNEKTIPSITTLNKSPKFAKLITSARDKLVNIKTNHLDQPIRRVTESIRQRKLAFKLGHFDETIVGVKNMERKNLSRGARYVGAAALLAFGVYEVKSGVKLTHMFQHTQASSFRSSSALHNLNHVSVSHQPTITHPTISLPSTPKLVDKPQAIKLLPNQEHYQYPWNWAKSLVGRSGGSPTQMLQNLANKAKLAGHQVSWQGSGTHAWLKIDGHSDTQTISGILDKFRS
jgi:ribosomal protein L14